MRIVPVIDLRAGRAVHARGGDRDLYRPVSSRLGAAVAHGLDDPGRLAACYAETLRPDWIYVADLDRIARTGDHAEALAAVAAGAPRSRLLWDGGFVDRQAAVAASGAAGPRGHGNAEGSAPAHRVVPVLASETLRSPDGLSGDRGWPAWIGLDLGAAALRAASPEVRALGEVGLLRRALDARVGGVVAIAIDRIGTGAGLPLDRLRRIRRAAPDCPLVAGGGVAGLADLDALRDLGCDAALVASALHDGRLSPAALRGAGYL